jgi:hypothetical protein
MSNYTEYIWSHQFSAMFGAYDIDKTDTLTFFVSHPSHGNLTVSSKQTIIAITIFLCNIQCQKAAITPSKIVQSNCQKNI